MVTESVIKREYTHVKPGNNIPFGIAGYYLPLEETRIQLNGRDVLCITGKVIMEAPCCKMAPDWVYAMVPGYVIDWQNSENGNGEKISVVEPVRDKGERELLRKIIQDKEGLISVDFW